MESKPADIASAVHKSKTLATFLALLLGFAGLHRFYLHGLGDRWGWLHALSVPLTSWLMLSNPELPLLMNAAPLVLSMLVASIETFVLAFIEILGFERT